MENEVEDVLTLLAVMVHVDQRVFAEEIEVFMSAAQLICSTAFHGVMPSEAVLLLWFEISREKIKDKIKEPDFDAWFNELLSRVGQVPRLDLILEAMTDIAKADNEVHISEHALLVLTENLVSQG